MKPFFSYLTHEYFLYTFASLLTHLKAFELACMYHFLLFCNVTILNYLHNLLPEIEFLYILLHA